ncbi:profilin-like [Ctenocephalides felis]|uniref:profilin-like n=1 Tax=Ctenocephalides felis TaxID=7515 RepID=UPI000E6E2837|nr:profilin-like [Ctenocephalides felis]
MSWENYIQKKLIGTRLVTKAAIGGHDGMVWAKSEDFGVTKGELSKLLASFGNQDHLKSVGVTLAGQNYLFMSGTDRVVRAKFGKVSVYCMKTVQTVIVSLFEEPIPTKRAIAVVEKLGDFLITRGY